MPKLCRCCKTEKPNDAFPVEKRNRDGLGSWCKPCKNNAGHEALKKDPAKLKRKEAAARIAKKKNHPDWKWKDKSAQLRYHYGISLADVERMKEEQGGKCKICQTVPKDTLVVDHCHTTLAVRGLLCRRCNAGLGFFDDCLEKLSTAMKYLKESIQNAAR